jgi:hypothetical protein
MSRSDSPEGGQTSGGYKSKSPSSASLEAWRSNVNPNRDLPDPFANIPNSDDSDNERL